MYGVEDPLELTDVERGAVNALVRAGTRAELSPPLVLAARELARAAAAGDGDPLAARRVRAALTHAAAFDPAPRARLVAGDAGQLVGALAADLPEGTHLGVGAATRGDRTWLVALSSVRKARLLAPFPRDLAPGTAHVLDMTLLGLDGARAVVTLPSGATHDVAATVGADRRSLHAALRFDDSGPYVVEVIGTGRAGPEVAALLTVLAGVPAASPPDARDPGAEPDDVEAAEQRVEEALNALRRAQRLAPVAFDPALKAVARSHSTAMRSRGVLAHVLPGTGDLAARLRRAGIAFRAAGENVARGRTALEAHEVAEESPAHRRNMLDARAKLAGVGISRGLLAGGEPVVYLTEILVDPGSPRSAGADARAELRRAVQLARRRAALPPLEIDGQLDALAERAATEMARGGARGEQALASAALQLEGRREAGADAIVSATPNDAARSKHAADRRFARFGVGVAPSSFAPGLLAMAIAYTD